MTQPYLIWLEACHNLILVWRNLFCHFYLSMSFTITSKLFLTVILSMLLSSCMH